MTDKLILFDQLVQEIRSCTRCDLPMGPNPVIQVSPKARLLIVGQAPGIRVHESGIPFNDPSGDRLRQWLNIEREQFYDPESIAIVPMGFCYPGTGKNGDLPPLPLCAELWRKRLLEKLDNVELTLVIGQYAQAWHLNKKTKTSVTAIVKSWRDYIPDVIPLPHPSPRNNRWLKTNPWFELEVVPYIQKRVRSLI